MSSIGGPGGIGGPKGPGGPTGVDGPDDVSDVGDVADVGQVDAAQASRAAGQLEAMAADIAAGKLTANEAIDRLVSEIAGSDQLGATERTELKEMLVDLVANDPYLQSLVGRT
jgi:hypothetical protein